MGSPPSRTMQRVYRVLIAPRILPQVCMENQKAPATRSLSACMPTRAAASSHGSMGPNFSSAEDYPARQARREYAVGWVCSYRFALRVASCPGPESSAPTDHVFQGLAKKEICDFDLRYHKLFDAARSRRPSCEGAVGSSIVGQEE